MKAEVTYRSNYNSVELDISGDDNKITASEIEEVVEKMTDHSFKFCDEDGEFYGDPQDLSDEFSEIIRTYFGDETEVVVEFDSIST